MTINRTDRVSTQRRQHCLRILVVISTLSIHTIEFWKLHVVLLASSTNTLVNFLYNLLRATVLISFDDASNVVLTLHLCNLTLKIWAYRVRVVRSFSVVNLIVWLMIRIA